jgi:hypothetical protein
MKGVGRGQSEGFERGLVRRNQKASNVTFYFYFLFDHDWL